MEKNFLRCGAIALFCCALTFSGCGKKSENGAARSPTPGSPATKSSGPTPAPPLSVPVTPALVTQDADSVSHYLHFPREPAMAARNSVVQFYCDITEQGTVEATYALVGNDEPFKAAVQMALDWGRFAPATIDGKAVAAYVGGTVIFTHDKGAPVIVVSLATHDRERVGKLQNYLQPQLLGGLRREVGKIIRQLPHNSPVGGVAVALVEVDERGGLIRSSVVGENPKGSGLGELLNVAVKGSQFTHAYENGKPVSGALDIIADFSKL